MKQKQKDKIKEAVSKANKGKVNNPKGRYSETFKINMSFEEAIKKASTTEIKKVNKRVVLSEE